MFIPLLIHYGSIAIVIVLSAFGGGVGQGIAGLGAIKALGRQSQGRGHITRAMILGLALTETGCVISLVIALMMLFGNYETITWGICLAELGMALALGFAAASAGIASGAAVHSSCNAIARQPFFGNKILVLMLLSQVIAEAPIIFSLIMALLIKLHVHASLSMYEGLRLFAAGLVMAVGTFGPSIGQAIFVRSSCRVVGLNKEVYRRLTQFAMLSQAVIETPAIFCLVISASIIYRPVLNSDPFSAAIVCIVAAVTMGMGSTGAAIATGYVASKSCEGIALNPSKYSIFVRTTLLAQAIIESSAIYALIVSLILLVRGL